MRLLVCLSLLAPLAPAAANTTPATTPEPATVPLETITVTARKREESLQDVPLAVTHRNAEQLREAGVAEVEDLPRTAPNLFIRPQSGQGTALIFQMRGQVQFDTLGTLDPSVAVYQDQIHLARPFGTNLAFVDVDNVQVLRGPQGTLFGRNTTGGAILLSTREPELNVFGGSLRSGLSSHDGVTTTGIVNLPLREDRWAVRAVAHRVTSDGYAVDQTNDRRLGDDGDTLLRLRSLWRAGDVFSLHLSGEYLDIDRRNGPAELAFAAQTRFVDADGDGTPETPVDGIARLVVATASQGQDSIDRYLGDPFRAHNDAGLDLTSRVRVHLASAIARWELDGARVDLILGRRDAGDIVNTADFDSTPYPVFDTTLGADYRQHSVELQLTGDTGRFTWAAGAYGFDEDARESTLGTIAGGLNLTDFAGDADARSAGVYTQISRRLAERWGLTAGLRYSADDKSLVSRNRVGSAQTGLRCAVPGVAPDAPCARRFENDSQRLNYLLALDYRPQDDVLLYSSLSTGYRAGGQNLRGLSEETFRAFEPEDITQIELGAKAAFWDRRLHANLAVYRAESRKLQRSILVRVDGFTSTFIGNVGEAVVHGGELELSLRPLRGLELGAALGITRPRYTRYVDLFGIDRSNEEVSSVPQTQYLLSARHTRPFAQFDWHNSINASWQSRVYNSQANIRDFAPDEQAAAERALTQPSLGLLGARSELEFHNGFGLALWGRNLTDEVYATGGLGLNGLGIAVRFPQPDRQIGVEASYRF